MSKRNANFGCTWEHLELLFFSPNCRQTRSMIKRGSTEAADVQTESKLWLYLRASWAFVPLSKLQTDMVKDQVWINKSNKCQESSLQKIPSDKPPRWTKEPLKHKNFLPMCKFPPLQHNLTKSRSKSNNLKSEKKTHDKTLNTRALKHLRRAFPPNHERRTWNKRHLKKKKKITDCRRKKQGIGDKKLTGFFNFKIRFCNNSAT
jgi:hypothetical protein